MLVLDATVSLGPPVLLEVILVESVALDVDVDAVAIDAAAIPELPVTSFNDKPGLSNEELQVNNKSIKLDIALLILH